MKTETLITRSLDNNIRDLDSLRGLLESHGKKDISDVRDFGRTSGGDLLAGFESGVSYRELVDLIDAMKLGVSHRRTAVSA